MSNRLRLAFISASFAIAGGLGCQAILGIDDTTFSPAQTGGDGGEPDTGLANDGAPTTDASTTDGSTTTDGGQASLLTLSPSLALVHRGEALDVDVTLQRGGFGGDATIVLAAVGDAGPGADGGASGVSVADLTLAAGSNTGKLHISASAMATLGLTSLSLTVTTGASATVTIPLVVAGAPGTLDSTFGVNGIVNDVPGTAASANGVACGDDGKIYVIGGSSPWIIRRYGEDGTADGAFDTAIKAFGSGSGTGSKIVVRGTVLVAGGGDGLNQISGTIDATFASSGTYFAKQGSNDASGTVTGLALAANGDVLATASITNPAQESRAWRIRGKTANIVSYGATVAAAGIDPDSSGNTIVGGALTTPDAGVLLWTQRLDSAFADAGTATSGTTSQYLSEGALAVSADRIGVFGGFMTGGGHSIAVFDSSSLAVISPARGLAHGGTWDGPFAAATAQRDGKMLGVGENGGSTSEFAFITRFESNGSQDTSFGSNGTFSAVGGPTSRIEFHDVAVDAFGRIVVVGSSDTLGWYIARVWP